MIKKLLLAGGVLLASALPVKAQVEPLLAYKVQHDPDCIRWVDSIASDLTLRQKVGQLLVYTIAPDQSGGNISHLRDIVKNYHVGGLLFSGGQIQDQVALTNLVQGEASVPLMITFDGEWGLSMRLKNTPVFPRNAILGTISDDRILYRYGAEVARQLREIGVHVNFAPVADVNINPKNPVIGTRAFGADPYLVADKVIAYSAGLESGGVLSVSKHFPGHGDTDVDSHKALPVLTFDRVRLDSVELYPFAKAIQAGVGGIMVGHLQVNAFDPGQRLPSSLSRNIVQHLLQEEMGFRGLIFTDALSMKGVGTPGSLGTAALKAGNDVLLIPRPLKTEMENILEAIRRGEISEEEIDRKCRKVLLYKYALGVQNQQPIRLSGLNERLNQPHVGELLHDIRRAAITVVANENNLLPLYPEDTNMGMVMIGDGASTFTSELNKYAYTAQYKVTPGTTESQRNTLIADLKKHSRILVCVAQDNIQAYASFLSRLSKDDHVIYVFFASHKTMEGVESTLRNASSIILAHTNQPDVQKQVAAVLFGLAEASGRLAMNLGQLYPAGSGVTLTPDMKPTYIPEDFGMRSEVLEKIDKIARDAIAAKAIPGCQIVILKEGKPVYDKAFGKHTYEGDRPVQPDDVYDIASLTKTSATLLAVMKLYDQGKLNITDLASQHLFFLKGTDKKAITIKELLLHQSGLPAVLPFWRELADPETLKGSMYSKTRDANHTIRVDVNSYINTTFDYKKNLVSRGGTHRYALHMGENMWIDTTFRDSIQQQIASATLRPRKYLYSCVGFILLQHIVEQITGMPLDTYLAREFYTPMKLIHTGYLPLRFLEKESVVPTVKMDYLRREMLQGYVHDEAAACQGGISGNAGLFSNAREIAQIHQMILNGGELNGKRYLSQSTCELFLTTKSGISQRVLGYNKPGPNGGGACSPSTPRSAYGHTGFTGTCAWVDPDNQLVYVFLSNCVYPDPWNNKLSALDVRRNIQETIYQSLIR
ncbi:MAG: serine hydrolase [Bacteroides sp.]|nr:serine hydrolase [Bacteroides sp.]